MIEIRIFRNEEGRISAYSVAGHSGTAERGEDIVCAGVSSLAQAALLGLGKHLRREVDFHVARGDLRVRLKGKPDELTEAVLETMALGLAEITGSYPEAVQVFDECEVD